MDDLNRFQSQRNVLDDPGYQALMAADMRPMSKQEFDAYMLKIAPQLQNAAPDGWYVADTSPSGINVLMPDECRPISLPHVRTYTAAKFSAGFWMCAAVAMVAGCVAALVRLA